MQVKKLLSTLIVSCAATLVMAPACFAQWIPDRPIKIVVPYPPGGPLDLIARLLADKAGAELKQPIIVENKAGAGGNIGADAVAKAAPDGYTLVMGAVATHAINPALFPKIPYDAKKDFSPLTQVASTPNVLIVSNDLPVKNVNQLIVYMKRNPGKLKFASGSNGSAGHLAGELFKMQAGVDMLHIPYKGGPAAMLSILSGDTQLMFDNLANASTHIKAGKVRAFAVTTAKKAPQAPELPTLAESDASLKDFDISTWFGLLLPANTPEVRKSVLHKAFTNSLNLPDVQEKMRAMGAEPTPSSPTEFAAFINSEAEKYTKLVKASGATFD